MAKYFNKPFILFVAFFVLPISLLGQRGLFFTGGFEFGGWGTSYKFKEGGNILAKGWRECDTCSAFAYSINPEIDAHYFFKGHFGVSAGLKMIDQSIEVHDQYFMSTHNIHGTDTYGTDWGGVKVNQGNFNITKWFLTPNVAGHFLFLNPTKKARPYISLGLGYNSFISDSRELTGEYYYASTDENLVLNATYKKQFISSFLELGFLFSKGLKENDSYPGLKMTTRGFIGSISFRVTMAGDFMQADYQNIQNNQPLYSDHFTANGTYYSLVFKVGGGIFGNSIDKAYKKKYVKKMAAEKEVVIPKKIEGRKLKFKNEINVHNRNIKILVWDHGKFDGDIISLNLNGSWILQNDTLYSQKKTIAANLNPGVNYLAVWAVSEGTEKPCTVSIIIDDGITEQTFVLNSDMNDCESLKINVENK